MSHEPAPVAEKTVLQERWEQIAQRQHELAASIEQIAAELPGAGKKHLLAHADWFKKRVGLNDVLTRPSTLALCLPLLKSDAGSELTTSEIDQAARSGFCEISRNLSGRQNVINKLLYPIFALVIYGFIGALFCFWILPAFEDVFLEFELELPFMANVVLGFARIVRQWHVGLIGLFAICLGLIWFLSRPIASRKPDRINRLGLWLNSKRQTLAAWAWHYSLLLEAGIPSAQSVEIAAQSSGKAWLKHYCQSWNELQSESSIQKANPLIPDSRFQLINETMSLSTLDGKLAMLKEIVNMYNVRSRTTADWWIQWLVMISIGLLGSLIVIAVMAMFMPLIGIMSGLTGA